jgi:hypothetical protein
MTKVVNAEILKQKLMNMQGRTYMCTPYIQSPYNHDINNMAQYMTSVINQEVSKQVNMALSTLLNDLLFAIQESTTDSGCILCREPSDHEKSIFHNVL